MQLVPVGVAATPGIFVVAAGFVYRLNATTGSVMWSYDLRRPSCSTDSSQAMPMVVLKEEFPALTDDLVVVSTAYTCTPGDRTSNRVIALRANPPGLTGQVVWQSPATIPLDRGVGGTIDYTNGHIYYAFRQPYASQPSVVRFAIANGAVTGADGLPWTLVAGDVTSIPQLRDGDRIFVGTLDATIRAYNLSTRALTLSAPIAPSNATTLTQSFAIGRGGGFDNLLVATTQDGYVRGVVITPAFSTSGANVTTVPWVPFRPGGVPASAPVAMATKVGKMFVPTTNGRIYQWNLATGLQEAYTTVGTGSLPQPALDVEGASASANRLLAAAVQGIGTTAQTNISQLCIPWNYLSGGETPTARKGDAPSAASADPLVDGVPCVTEVDCPIAQFGGDATGVGNYRIRACLDGACASLPTNVGGACTVACVGTGISLAGNCVLTQQSGTAGGCVCNAAQPIGGFGCNTGQTCLGAAGCHNLLTDPQHCGAAFHACEEGVEECIEGHCERYYCHEYASWDMLNQLAAEGQIAAPTLGAIAWHDGQGEANQCDFILGLTESPVGGSAIARVTPSGSVTYFTQTDFAAPITSVAVDPDDPETVFGTYAAFNDENGGFVYTQGQDAFASIAAADSGLVGSRPFALAALNSGAMGTAIQRGTGEVVRVYFGNNKGDGTVARLEAFPNGSGYDIPNTEGDDVFVAPPGNRILGLSYAPPIPSNERIDGRLWIMYEQVESGGIVIGAFCDVTLNEGNPCNSPGWVEASSVAVGGPVFERVMPGFAVRSSGDYVFTGRVDGEVLYEVWLIAGQDFSVLNGNKVFEAVQLPIVPPQEDLFSLVSLGGVGLGIFPVGSESQAQGIPYLQFQSR